MLDSIDKYSKFNGIGIVFLDDRDRFESEQFEGSASL